MMITMVIAMMITMMITVMIAMMIAMMITVMNAMMILSRVRRDDGKAASPAMEGRGGEVGSTGFPIIPFLLVSHFFLFPISS